MNAYATKESITAFKETATQVCFCAMMGIAATFGILGTVSFMFSYLVG